MKSSTFETILLVKGEPLGGKGLKLYASIFKVNSYAFTDEVLKGHQILQQENQAVRQKLEQQSANLQQLNELTNMLQESHRYSIHICNFFLFPAGWFLMGFNSMVVHFIFH